MSEGQNHLSLVPNSPEQLGQYSEPESVAEMTEKQVVKAAEVAKSKGAETVNILGKEVNVLKVTDDLKRQLELSNNAYAKLGVPRIGEKVIYKKLPGNTVGESKTDRTEYDPASIAWPVKRGSHLRFHEKAHRNGKIDNEGMVEALAQAMFADSGNELTADYNNAVSSFREFAEKFDSSKSVDENITSIYKLYVYGCSDSKFFAKIYKTYVENHVEKLPDQNQKDEGIVLFRTVFPELKFDYNGEVNANATIDYAKHLYEMKHNDENPDPEPDEADPDNVVGLADRKTAETLQKLDPTG